MFATERQREIIEFINAKGAAKIGELTERFGVSVETIRRDLLELEKQNSLRRVHGGALRMPQSLFPNPTFLWWTAEARRWNSR